MATKNADLPSIVYASTWSMLAVSTIFFGVRSYSRLRKGGAGFWTDDWVMLVGWLFLLAAQGILTWLMSIFLIPTTPLRIPLARIHHNLQTISLALTKTSFGVTLLRLMPGRWESKLIWGLLITMNLQFAVHIIATWQALCGEPDDGHHIGGDRCWQLSQSVTFTVFSALYSAICDFVLAVLPWRMIFNLKMKRSERVGVAVALSMGILAGITGIMKAVEGYLLLDITDPNYFYNQCCYWIWTMAEPNVTIISASIPVLRSFVRTARKRGTGSSPGAGAYIKTGDGSSRFHTITTHNDAKRANGNPPDNDSDTSILGQGRSGTGNGGITWTTEVSVDFDVAPQKGGTKSIGSKDHYEMVNLAGPKNPSSVRITSLKASPV
ncbi:hypothetical protein BX600DRAFT_467283 [Xylariales sp. PMI_506]|nr:hypothetical protein BX600DRAFT_467283 [Xylariales sp. PMI_506]